MACDCLTRRETRSSSENNHHGRGNNRECRPATTSRTEVDFSRAPARRHPQPFAPSTIIMWHHIWLDTSPKPQLALAKAVSFTLRYPIPSLFSDTPSQDDQCYKALMASNAKSVFIVTHSVHESHLPYIPASMLFCSYLKATARTEKSWPSTLSSNEPCISRFPLNLEIYYSL